MAKRQVVVVDGSNLATEGRTIPSLVQLDECVTAFAEEFSDAEIIVVVDATFEHRIVEQERKRFKDAELAGEIVTPPAGAVGRGDAFILKIATRANAVVLSNDSFQEFHSEYEWLFDEGRLIGGKPIPGIGWIFTPRNPVRGAKSRAVRAKAAASQSQGAENSPQIGDVRPSTKAKTPRVPTASAKGGGAKTTTSTITSDDDAKSPRPARTPRKRSAAATPAAATSTAAAPTAASTSKPRAPRAATASKATTHKSTRATAKTATTPEPARTKRAAATKKAPARTAPPKQSARPSTKKVATTEKAPAKKGATPTSKAPDSTPVNTPRAFLALVSEHPLKSRVVGTVTTFTSHGAMITINVGRRMEAVCYAPLAGLARPAPTRARDVLKKGEQRDFLIVAYDTKRRIAELSLVPV